MSTSIHHIAARHKPSAPLRLTHTTRLIADREQTLTGVRGLTWVTIDNELRDTVLGSGQRTTIPARRLVVVTSLRPEAAFEVSLSALPGNGTAAAIATGGSRSSAPRVSAWQRLARPFAAALGALNHGGSPA